MATIGGNYFDLIDHYKSIDGKGSISAIIEMLCELNPVMEDAIFTECNEGKTHLTTIRTGLPDIAWGKLYKGIPQSKSNRQQVRDTTGFLTGMLEVDQRMLDLHKDKQSVYLTDEARGFLESLSQKMQLNFFYGDESVTPEGFTGLAPRYAYWNTSRTVNNSSRQVINGGGAGTDNYSIWFVTHGDSFTSIIHPKNTEAGIKRTPFPNQLTLDADGNKYPVYNETYEWHLGVSVRDWRNNARIANISEADLLSGNVKLFDLMHSAYHRMHRTIPVAYGQTEKNKGTDPGKGKTVCYMNRVCLEWLEKQDVAMGGMANTALRITPAENAGREVKMFRDIPIRITDALLTYEDVVPQMP